MPLSNRTVSRFINHSNNTGVSGTHTPTGTPNYAVLLVGGSMAVPTTVTYGGVAMTLVNSYVDYSRRVLVYVLPNPLSGAQTVSVTGSLGGRVTVWCLTYTGVDVGGTPYVQRVGKNFGGAIPASYSEAVTSAADSELVGIVGATGLGSNVLGGSQTHLTGSPVTTDGNGWSGHAWYAPGGTTPVTGTLSELCAMMVLEIVPAPVQVTPRLTFSFGASSKLTNEDYSLRVPAVDDFYLDPNAGVDGTGSEASPWNVFTNAKLSTLTAGKILWIKNGTFNWASLTTLNSGTWGNRIKIAAYPGHTPVATLSSSTVGFDSSYGFGKAGGCSYWDIVGITFNLAGRAGIIFGATQWNNPVLAATNIRVIDCSGNTTLAFSDNGGILFFDSGAEDVQVIRGTYTATGATGGSGTNRALIWADYQKNIKIVGTVLNATGTSLPFYYKHTNAQTAAECERVFRNNIVRGGSRGTLFCGKYFQVINNVFDGALVDFGDQGGGDVGRGQNTIVHNTFYNANLGLTTNGVGGENYDNIVRDNVLTGTTELWDNPYASTNLRTRSSYNAYDAGAAEIRRNSTTYSLTSYRTAFPDREISSVSGSISFTGAASNTPANWQLAGGSAGRTAASDGTDCGVNVAELLTATP